MLLILPIIHISACWANLLVCLSAVSLSAKNKHTMRHDKLERELRLILLLTENHDYTIEELCGHVGISRRNFYYYIEFLLVSRISFTEEEAVLLRRMLDKAEHGNALIANLKRKLERFYDFDILADEALREHAVHNIGVIYDAIKLKRQVVLKGYASPHSHTVRDRFVEPFLLMNNNNEVRCYEPSSGMNKTFKVSRMQEVVILDSEWDFERKHRQMFTDVFMFSGEELMPVELTLGQLSYNIMKEEYPQAKPYLSDCDDGRHLLRLDVCSYAGIGRFVLGLYDDIRVLGGDGFKSYLKAKVDAMKAC